MLSGALDFHCWFEKKLCPNFRKPPLPYKNPRCAPVMALMVLDTETLSSKTMLGTTSDSVEAYSYGRRHCIFLVTHSNLRMHFRRHEIKWKTAKSYDFNTALAILELLKRNIHIGPYISPSKTKNEKKRVYGCKIST